MESGEAVSCSGPLTTYTGEAAAAPLAAAGVWLKAGEVKRKNKN